MMRRGYVLLIVASVLVLASCARKKSLGRLEAISEYADSEPYMARLALDSIDAGALRGESRALYALLTTQTACDSGEDIESDSLISIATDWYGDRRKSCNGAASWYYLGCVNDLLGHDTIAIDAYLKALRLFPDTLVRCYARCENGLGRHFVARDMLDEAKRYLAGSRMNSERLNDPAGVSFADYYLALIAMYQMDFEKARTEFGKLTEDSRLSDYYRNQCYLQLSKINMYVNGNFNAARYYIDRYISNARLPDLLGAAYTLKGQIFYALCQYDSARYYFQESQRHDVNDAGASVNYRYLTELSAMDGVTDSAAYYAGMHIEAIESLYDEENQAEMNRMLYNHYSELKDRQVRVQRRNSWIIAGFGLLSLALLLLLLYYRKENQLKSRYNQMQDELRKDKIKTFDTLSMQLRECEEKFQDTASFVLIRDSQLGSKPLSSDDAAFIRHELNVCFSKAISLIMETGDAKVSPKEALYCVLNYMNVREFVSAQVLAVKSDSLRMYKYRLKSKMSEEHFNQLFG